MRRVDVLRSLKWSLDRKSLSKLYLAYVRPILESGCCVWVNCTDQDRVRLENVQLGAARIVTGAKRGTNHGELYRETGWQSLTVRRVNQCLALLFRMLKNEASEQLIDLLPVRAGSRTDYNIRNSADLTVPRAKSTSHQKSFLPSACKNWNNLPDDIKFCNSTEEFKEKIKGEKTLVPTYYNVGERKEQILQCQLRVGNANLNANLHAKGMSLTPSCECGFHTETTDHYLLWCTQYDDERTTLLDTLSDMEDITSELLLRGNNDLSDKANTEIFLAVQEFIKSTGRFEK